MSATRQTPVIVLAGGASRRMGTDKRGLPIDGTPMLQRVIDRLAGHPVILVVDPRRDAPPTQPCGRIRVIHDTRPGEGPLAALEAGLAATAADNDIALVVAGDMPWLEPAIVDLLLDRLICRPSADLACLTRDARPQPFPIACRHVPTLTRVSALLDSGERRLRSVLAGPWVEAISEPEWRRVDPAGRTLRDIDTPADLARLR